MNYNALRADVCAANQQIVNEGLVLLTWGNVSGVDPDRRVMAIKPSGVDYRKLTPDEIVVLSLEDGSVLEGTLNPSSDAPTHLVLYRAFPEIRGIVHTHSSNATSWAQAGASVPCLGTTHADHFYGEIPVTRPMTQGEIREDYEANTGHVIVERFRTAGIDPNTIPGVLVHGHGPFTWGPSIARAVENSVVLEEVAGTAIKSRTINPAVVPLDQTLLDKHFLRKHGPGAYYGQDA